MSEWWTYRLSDFLMFSPAIYGRMVERYLQATGPAPWLLTALGLALVASVARARRTGGAPWWGPAALCGVLALPWAWVGWAFHWQRFAQIHTAAPYLAAGFWLQAALLAVAALAAAVRPADTAPELALEPAVATRRVGVALALAGVLGWPLLSGWWGQALARAEAFALMPEPTALATLGLLLMLQPRGWRLLCAIPLLSLLNGGLTLWAMAG